MPIISKYDSKTQQQLLEDIMAVFHGQQVPTDLAMMTLGNAVSNIITQSYPGERQRAIAEQFGKVLLQSLPSAKN